MSALVIGFLIMAKLSSMEGDVLQQVIWLAMAAVTLASWWRISRKR